MSRPFTGTGIPISGRRDALSRSAEKQISRFSPHFSASDCYIINILLSAPFVKEIGYFTA